MALTMYGIRNCDTIKKARAWLDARGVSYAFHDYKIAGIDELRLRAWVAELGWESLELFRSKVLPKIRPASG